MTHASPGAGTTHRVPYANSRPRLIKLVGLGARGAAIADSVGARGMAHVEVVASPELAPELGAESGPPVAHLRRSLAAGANALARALEGCDMIYVVIGPGDDASLATAIGRHARERGVLVTGVIVDSKQDAARAMSQGLHEMRRACDMLVVTADTDDVAGMLAALGT